MKGLQPSMSAGELSPGLHGRVDLARYAIGLKLCRNVIVKPSGGATKRPGYQYRGQTKTGTDPALLFPFIYSTEVRYLIEAGDEYFRFWYVNDAEQIVQLESAPGVPYELASPYLIADIENLRITQSADVMYFINGDYQTRELRRLTPSTFEVRTYENRLGPFRPLNTNDGAKAAVSAATGNVTVACSEPIFTANMVGALFFIEEQELRAIPPWEPAQKNVAIGSLRRSDGKIYRATGFASGGTYYITGSVRPVHEEGRAWDGGQDIRNDGVNNYGVGIEWEYVSAGYGIAKLTSYTDANTMSGLVIVPFPDSCVGVPSATTTWTLSGDGTTTTFAIAGASSPSVQDYTAAIGGVGVPP